MISLTKLMEQSHDTHWITDLGIFSVTENEGINKY